MPLPKWNCKFQLKKDCWVFVPTEDAKKRGQKIKEQIESFWQPPRYYFHLRDGGHVKALRLHESRKQYLHLDIKDFFGCVNRSKVTRALKSRIGYDAARQIATNSTVRAPNDSGYILPRGFVESPILASICLRNSRLGDYLHKLHDSEHYEISVYMDDIIVSADSDILLQEALTELESRANRSKFPLNTQKTQGPCKQISAFNIELSPGELRVTTERMAKFLDNYKGAESDDCRNGILNYVKSVNPGQSQALKEEDS